VSDPLAFIVILALLAVGLTIVYVARRLQQQRQLIEELQAARDRFSSLAANLPGTIYIFNFRTGQVDFASQSEFLGYTPEELQQSVSMREQVHPADIDTSRAFWRALAAGGRAEDGGPLNGVEYRMRHKDGHWEWLYNWATTLSHQPDGQPEQVLVVANTVSERRQALDALADREHRLRLLVSQVPAVLWTTDTNLIFTSSVGSGLAGLGLEPDQVVGADLFTYFATGDPDFEPIAAHRQALEGHSRRYESQFNGRTFQVSVEPLRDSTGQISGTVGVAVDISDRLAAEQALQQGQRLESLGLMAGGVAHDFNNLLVAMLGQAGLAQVRLERGSPARPHLDRLVEAAETAASLTRQLLAYSGRGQFERRPLQLNRLIEENRHLFEAAASHRVTLHTELAEGLPLIEADPGQMQQLIMNLILNAAAAVEEPPGRVVLRTAGQVLSEADGRPLGRFTGRPLGPGAYVCLELSDNGRGLEPETAGRIFEPFYTTGDGSRGLGLAAVLGIARGHGAGLAVESRPQGGTTFRLYFPAVTEEAAAAVEEGQSPPGEPDGAAQDEEPAAGDGEPGWVLVVDDEVPICQVVADILQDAGLRVVTAFNGFGGVEEYAARPGEIGLVLLDLTMPGMSGEQTLAELRAIDPQVRVLLSSGYNREEISQRLSGPNVVGFLKKPYDAETLVNVVRQHLAHG
jgi:two-component system, cell cycle sensor histidine kinase and response regulator CckA